MTVRTDGAELLLVKKSCTYCAEYEPRDHGGDPAEQTLSRSGRRSRRQAKVCQPPFLRPIAVPV